MQHFRHILKFLFLLVLVAACETAPVAPPVELRLDKSGGVTLPYYLSDQGHFLVDVRVNGADPVPFIIDTGATVSTVYRSTVERLQLEPIAGETMIVHGLVSSEPRPVTHLNSIEIGALSFTDTRVPILDAVDDGVPRFGIIGMNILAQNTLLFDADRQTITFLPPDQFDLSRYASWDAIRLTRNEDDGFRRNLLFFYLTSRNTRFIALLDLGASFSALNWDAARFPELVTAKKFVLEQQKISGAIEEFVPSFRARFETLTSGEYGWAEQEFLVIDIRAEELHGIVEPGMMIAGADMFAGRTFIVSPRDQVLIVRPTAQDRSRRESEQNSTRP